VADDVSFFVLTNDPDIPSQPPNTQADSLTVGRTHLRPQVAEAAVRFDLPAHDDYSGAARLQLSLFVIHCGLSQPEEGGPVRLELSRITEPWRGQDLNGRFIPSSEDRVSSEIIPASSSAHMIAGEWVNVDVSDYFRDWESGTANYGVLIRYEGNEGTCSFRSSESSQPPRLVLTLLDIWLVFMPNSSR
jgi:hypothetical protein